MYEWESDFNVVIFRLNGDIDFCIRSVRYETVSASIKESVF